MARTPAVQLAPQVWRAATAPRDLAREAERGFLRAKREQEAR